MYLCAVSFFINKKYAMEIEKTIKKNGIIPSIIEERMKMMGISQNNFAKTIGATPSQLGIFLKGDNMSASLPPQSLNAALSFVGIDMGQYMERIRLANEVADVLIDAGVSNIDSNVWTKEKLSDFTGIKKIKYFFDVDSKEDFDNILMSGLVDYESTFVHFKALVSYCIEKNKLSKKKNEGLTSSEAIKISKECLFDVDDYIEKKVNDSLQKKNSIVTDVLGPGLLFGAIGIVYGIGYYVGKKIGERDAEDENEKIGSQAGAHALWQKKGLSLIGKALKFFQNK